MRTTLLRLALLGTAFAVPAYAQTSPAAPDRTAPATDGQRGTVTTPPAHAPAPRAAAPDARSGAPMGATIPNRAADSTTGTTTATPGTDRGGNAAARVDDGTRTGANPAPGANSFTEGQAKSRIEAAGFTNVSDLQKDDQGIWRGKAQQNGRQVSVALDYQGQVTPATR